MATKKSAKKSKAKRVSVSVSLSKMANAAGDKEGQHNVTKLTLALRAGKKAKGKGK